MIRSLLKHTAGIALVWVVVLVALMAWLRSYSQPSAQREVPNVVTLGREEAAQTLLALGLEAVWQDSIYAAQGTPGAVVEQHPPAGSSVKAGRNILLTTYRLTPPSEAVSVREGQDARLAERILTTRGFDVSIEEEVNSLLAGKVIRAEKAGTKLGTDDRLPKGSSITLVVGTKGSEMVRVPWLMGLSLKDAKGVLSRRNLAVGYVEYSPSVRTALDTTLAVVVDQDANPSKEPQVKEGTAIDLYLGKH